MKEDEKEEIQRELRSYQYEIEKLKRNIQNKEEEFEGEKRKL